MSSPPPAIAALIRRAGEARARGDLAGARQILATALEAQPDNPAAHNMLGLLAVGAGDHEAGARHFAAATAADPKAAPLWLNLADAHRRAGRPAEQLAALDGALVADPYSVPAMAAKAGLLDAAGRADEAVRCYRALAKMAGDPAAAPPLLRHALERGAVLIAEQEVARRTAVAPAVAAARDGYPAADRRRADAYLAARYEGRRIYVAAPTGPLFPFLPADEYFDRALFPWFRELEAATGPIRAEVEALLAEREAAFRPYIQFPPGVPVNQWAELQNSSKWDAFFLWKDGQELPDALARFPRTAAALRPLPLLDVAGKGPTVMVSLLNPRTTIPAHTGTTNVRATVHLPLIVPGGDTCRFRVGGETRVWREGEAWAFDDTIEHEAWNDSDAIRVILIVDAWNPHLTAAERAIVRAVGG